MIAMIAAVVGFAGVARALPADGVPPFGVHTPLALSFAGVAAALPLILAVVRLIERRPAHTLSSVTGRLRWLWLGVCLCIAVPSFVLYAAGTAMIAVVTGPPARTQEPVWQWVGTSTYVTSLAIMLAIVAVQVSAEEYLYRGVLLQAAGRFFGPAWPAILLQATMFAATHGIGTGWGLLAACYAGVALGWLTVRTGGLEAVIAYHLVVNATPMLLVLANNQPVDHTASITDLPWQHTLVNIVVVTTYTLVVALIARDSRLATRTCQPLRAAPPVRTAEDAATPSRPEQP